MVSDHRSVPVPLPGSLAGPMVRDSCAVDCSAHGLVAYTCGPAVAVVDLASMQLVHTLTHGDRPEAVTTAVQFLPEGLSRDLARSSQLRLAAGDKLGRIAIWDVVAEQAVTWLVLERPGQRIEEVRWVVRHPWLLAALYGPTQAVLWDPSTETVLLRYDTGQEPLMSIATDPHDHRQVCIVGARGQLVSLLISGTGEGDASHSVTRLPLLEPREKPGGGKEGVAAGGAAILEQNPVLRCLFSPKIRGILFVLLPREILVYDAQFGRFLGSTPLPRSFVRMVDLVVPLDGSVIFSLHADSSLSVWQRQPHQHSYVIRHVEPLVPSMASAPPAAQVLAMIHCPQPWLALEPIAEPWAKAATAADSSDDAPPLGSLGPRAASMGREESESGGSGMRSVGGSGRFGRGGLNGGAASGSSSTLLMVFTDDGKLWQWQVSADPGAGSSGDEAQAQGGSEQSQSNRGEGNARWQEAGAALASPEQPWLLSFRVELQGMLQALPSAITTLAVPTPSILATTPGIGAAGSGPARAVPLVALATQGGTVELLDSASHALCASFSLHPSMVRGVRWLGNHRLISFSYTEVKGKGGGFQNRVVVTDVRSGQSRPFRVMPQPERSPMRGLRTSPSGRYVLILFREAPAEVWAMTRSPTMLRSLALPFTVMEWALPPLPLPEAHTPRGRSAMAATPTSVDSPPDGGEGKTPGGSVEEPAESFAFALVNGSLGVFELRGRRVRDFRPKWPSASFVAVDVLVTAMAYRMPHVVMGDRLGHVRWWDVTTGQAASFNTHRGGIRRIRFAPVLPHAHSRGRALLLFNDRSFALFDLDVGEVVPTALAKEALSSLAVLEVDWLPLQGDAVAWPDAAPQLLCTAAADGSLRLLEVHASLPMGTAKPESVQVAAWQRFRPTPFGSVALLPSSHARALRLLLQQGVQPSWLEPPGEEEVPSIGDLRRHLLDTAPLLGAGQLGVTEVLLKGLEPHRLAGRLLEVEAARAYVQVCRRGTAARCAFVAAHFGDTAEADFWRRLPHALHLLSQGSAGRRAFWDASSDSVIPEAKGERGSGHGGRSEEEAGEESTPFASMRHGVGGRTFSQENLAEPEQSPGGMKWSQDAEWGETNAVRAAAMERINWHEKLPGVDVAQKRVHEFVAVGDYEAAVTLLLASPADSPTFFVDALRAVALASAVSPAMHELAVKVVAANMVQTQEPLAGLHLLCAVGRYQEACSQLQDAGRWVDACTLASTHLSGSDRTRVLERWAHHCLHNEHDLWRAVTLFVSSGALSQVLTAMQDARQPDTAVMFLLACHEAREAAVKRSSHQDLRAVPPNGTSTETSTPAEGIPGSSLQEPSGNEEDVQEASGTGGGGGQGGGSTDSAAPSWEKLDLPGELRYQPEQIRTVCELFEQYERWLAHLCVAPQ